MRIELNYPNISMDKALNEVMKLLRDNCGTYPNLTGSLILDFNLINDEGCSSPSNDQQFTISENSVYIDQANTIKEELLKRWKFYIRYINDNVSTYHEKIRANEVYLKKAVQENKPDVEWINQLFDLEEYKKTLIELEEKQKLVSALDLYFTAGKALLYKEIIKCKNITTIYSCLIYEDVCGYSGYYDAQGLSLTLPIKYKG